MCCFLLGGEWRAFVNNECMTLMTMFFLSGPGIHEQTGWGSNTIARCFGRTWVSAELEYLLPGKLEVPRCQSNPKPNTRKKTKTKRPYYWRKQTLETFWYFGMSWALKTSWFGSLKNTTGMLPLTQDAIFGLTLLDPELKLHFQRVSILRRVLHLIPIVLFEGSSFCNTDTTNSEHPMFFTTKHGASIIMSTNYEPTRDQAQVPIDFQVELLCLFQG